MSDTNDDLVEYPEVGRRPIGTIVAINGDNGPIIGWSKCSEKDRFNRKRGIDIAHGRASMGVDLDITKLPMEYQDAFQRTIISMNSRAQKYFK
jgi:hypothetical protein